MRLKYDSNLYRALEAFPKYADEAATKTRP